MSWIDIDADAFVEARTVAAGFGGAPESEQCRADNRYWATDFVDYSI